jgi:hypothetical protein
VTEVIRTGGKKLRGQVEAIRATLQRELTTHGDYKRAKQEVSELKKQLPAVLWSGTFTERANDKLVSHSGLLCADLDSLNSELPSVRGKLLESPHVWTLFVSPSGDGLKAVFRVPPDAVKHLASFRAVEQHVSELTGIQIDQSCKDSARMCFLSYDPDIYHNANAREIEPLPEPEKPARPVITASVDLTLRERIAAELLGKLEWWPEKGAFLCKCPGEHLHTNSTREKHCMVYLDGSPTIKCQHNSCSTIVEVYTAQLRSRIGKAEYQVEQENDPTGVVGAGNGLIEPVLAPAPKANSKGSQGAITRRHYTFSDLSTISAKAVDWIEEPYLARGEMHFLQGQGGSYNGTLVLTWAAEFSQRGEHVLLVLAEDDLAKKVKPLLMAAKADMAFIHPLTIRCGENEDALVLPDDLDQLERAMVDSRAALVIIDPLLSHVSGRLDSYRDHDMKRVLTRIGSLAQRTNAAIVCVHHTKKDTSGGMKLAGQGSTAFYTTARLVMTMAKLSEEQVVLEVVKSNLGPEGVRQLLRADIVGVEPGIKVPRLTRAGESPVGVAEVLTGERKEKETKTLTAAKLILTILEEEGEQKQIELFDRVAQETGLSPKTIRNKAYFGVVVEEDLVQNRKDGFRGVWMVARSDRERPAKLRSVTPKSNRQGYTSEKGYSSAFYEGNSTQQLSYSSCVSMPKSNLAASELPLATERAGFRCPATCHDVSVIPSHGGMTQGQFLAEATRLLNATPVKDGE